jgi:hypothetical protein
VAAQPRELPSVDAENPWLGLASFTEESRPYFFGREGEVAELARRVQRKLLTVLFGQSGLGKTSILRAGLVPRLRGQGYCPVYVRIDYGRDAPSPAEQIKQAIFRTARRSGEWTQVGVAAAGETLWEFLHHRDDVLKDESGATLIPLLIFDQFEEIFTLGQGDDFGRARAKDFIEDLADLVENRPPRSFEARLDADDSAAESFDFARSDYRVLIALREDYLAPLESVKGVMPSVTQNRVRLAPMTGVQALEAVTGPGGSLVSAEVAEAIVRFIAGSELANAEVEPSLLSLICRELNEARRAQGRKEISIDLLEGSRGAILENFYERALADQPVAVRRVIEDDLLTESGFRDNVAEETMQARLAAAGAAPDALAVLVNRRLLRIEERLDVRRVELTHDVLCDVVKGSRDVRKEREAREATERALAEQREREAAAHRSMVRARQVAGVCIVLLVAALAAAAYGFVTSQRARRAEALATETRREAETARSQAEHLIGYLTDDFTTELEGFGRLDVLEGLGEREIGYYRSLPAALESNDTRASRALAEVRYGTALQLHGRLAEARTVLTDAIDTLKRLRAGGETGERIAIGLALGIGVLGDVEDREGRGGLPLATESEAMLRPYFEAPKPSVAVRRAYGLVAEDLGSYQGRDGIPMLERAKGAFAGIGALDLTDIAAAADYAQAASFEGEPLFFTNRDGELRAVMSEAAEIAGRVLEQRPGHLVALRAQSSAFAWLAGAAWDERRAVEASRLQLKSAGPAAALVRLDPTHSDDRQSYAGAIEFAGQGLTQAGRTREGAALIEQAIAIWAAEAQPSNANLSQRHRWTRNLAVLALDAGESAHADRLWSAAEELLTRIRRESSPDSMFRVNAELFARITAAERAYLEGRLDEAARLSATAAEHLGDARANNENVERIIAEARERIHRVYAQTEYFLGHDAAALEQARAAGASGTAEQRAKPDFANRLAQDGALAALALARLGRTGDARAALAPAIAYVRAAAPQNHDVETERAGYVISYLAEAVVEPSLRSRDLAEAEHVLATLGGDTGRRASVRRWAEAVRAERARAP